VSGHRVAASRHERRIVTTPIEQIVLGQTAKLRRRLGVVPVGVGYQARDARIVDSVDGIGEQIRNCRTMSVRCAPSSADTAIVNIVTLRPPDGRPEAVVVHGLHVQLHLLTCALGDDGVAVVVHGEHQTLGALAR
jgi:hypothetical protein